MQWSAWLPRLFGVLFDPFLFPTSVCFSPAGYRLVRVESLAKYNTAREAAFSQAIGNSVPTMLFHGTSPVFIPRIIREGLKVRTAALSHYEMETVN